MPRSVLTDSEAFDLVKKVFEQIEKFHSIEEITLLIRNVTGEKKFNNEEEKYPQITFSISKEEIKSIISSGKVKENYSLNQELGSTIIDPITKLLYALAWKNGDLKKLKHIIKGIADSAEEENDQDDALVFYHFGKHLTRQTGQPIIDQHVLRSFELFKNKSSSPEKIRLNDKCTDKNLIAAYKKWWVEVVEKKINGNFDMAYKIDKLLFAVGKKIKLSKKNKVIEQI